MHQPNLERIGAMAWTDVDSKAGWGTGRALVNALAAIATNFGILKAVAPNVRSSAAANYTLQLDDEIVRATKADGAQTITIPTNAAVAFPVGKRIRIHATTAQVVTIAPAGTVTANQIATKTLAIDGQYGVATLEKVAANEWLVSGDLEAAA
jgi:voltage-gated potassium channel Kch